MSTPTPPDLAAPYWGHAHLAAVLPISRTRRYEVIREPDFPRPIRLTADADPLWVAEEVRHWLASRPRVVPAPRKVRSTPVAPSQGVLGLQPAQRRRRAS